MLLNCADESTQDEQSSETAFNLACTSSHPSFQTKANTWIKEDSLVLVELPFSHPPRDYPVPQCCASDIDSLHSHSNTADLGSLWSYIFLGSVLSKPPSPLLKPFRCLRRVVLGALWCLLCRVVP